MRIIGFNFEKIKVERKKDLRGKLEIKTNIDIEDIEKESLDIAGDVLKFSYDYVIKYEPEFAEINFKGTTLLLPDKPEDIKKILKDWKKKKLAEETRILVFNFIMAKCNLKALQLEDDFALPPHIPLPRISRQTQPTGTTGQANYTG